MSDAITPPPAGRKEKLLFAGAIGFVLVVALVSIRPDQPRSAPSVGAVSSTAPQVDPEKVPLVTGEEPLQTLFIRPGCPVCHTIPGIEGANGQVGPPLWLGETAGGRLRDPQYRGTAKSAREYIVESIVSPGTYVVPGFPPDTMPNWYGQKLSAGALDRIATYLEELKKPPAAAR